VIDGTTPVNAATLNSLEMGGNVYASPAGGLLVDISPIRGLIGGTERAYAGTTDEALAPSNTSYLYINAAGNLVVNTTGFPIYGTGGGEELYFPLATVVCSAVAITAINDRRWRFAV
jgi:hypothetical protein